MNFKEIFNEEIDREHVPSSFTGKEIEKTDFFGMQSVFVSYKLDINTMVSKAKKAKAKHIFLEGLNDENGKILQVDLAKQSIPIAKKLIDLGFYVTIEARPECITEEFMKKCPKPNSSYGKKFCILVCVYIPDIAKMLPYTTVKLYDDFGDGDGVYCMHAKKFVKQSHLTKWNEYDDDAEI